MAGLARDGRLLEQLMSIDLTSIANNNRETTPRRHMCVIYHICMHPELMHIAHSLQTDVWTYSSDTWSVEFESFLPASLNISNLFSFSQVYSRKRISITSIFPTNFNKFSFFSECYKNCKFTVFHPFCIGYQCHQMIEQKRLLNSCLQVDMSIFGKKCAAIIRQTIDPLHIQRNRSDGKFP